MLESWSRVVFGALVWVFGGWLLVSCSDPGGQRCVSAFDCNEGQICSEGACLTPDPCVVDGDCAAGVCESGQCLNRGCFVDADCGARRICALGSCAAAPPERCFSHEDCASGRCNLQTGECGPPPAPCERDQSCGPEERCVDALCQLAEGCAFDPDCPDGTACIDGLCRTGCRLEPDSCPDDQWCDPGTRICASGCAEDVHCDPDEYCSPAGCARGCRVDGCGPGATCDPMTRRCSCEGDAGCPEGTYCGADGCQPGCRADDPTCVEGTRCDLESRTCRCAADSCPERFACDPVSGACVEVAPCVEDAECAADAWCSPEGCVPGCRVDGCGDARRCDVDTRICLCEADAGCPAAEYCDAGACRAGCRDGGCPNGACNLETRRCECAEDAGCPDGQYCADRACVDGCRVMPDDCAQGRCNPQTRECDAAMCLRDADCAADQACVVVIVEGLPALRCAAAFADGRAEAPCDANLDCASRLCLEDGFCFAGCVNDLDCPSRACETISLIVDDDRQVDLQSCIPPQINCGSDADCGDDQACVPLQSGDPLRPDFVCRALDGRLPGGAACQEGAQCGSNNCFEGNCFALCDPVANDCDPGQRCYPNQVFFGDDRGTPTPADDRFLGYPACRPDQGSGQACLTGRCPAGEACTVRFTQNREGLDRICRTAVGAGLGGAICRAPGECASGLCLDQGICFGVCDPNAPAGQCAPNTGCGEVIFTLNDRGTEQPFDDLVAEVPACVP